MLGLVGRKRLEKAEAETSMVLAQFAEAVATAKEFLANHHRTMALLRDWQRMYEEWGAELAEVRAELKQVRGERDLAHWVIKIPGMETGGPPTLIGTYDPNGH